MRRVLVDSSASLALLDRKDPGHERIGRAVLELRGKANLFLTNFLVAETYALLGIRLSWDAARDWLRTVCLDVLPVTPEDEAQARAVLLGHDDQHYSYADATSFAVMRRLGVTTALTLDRHFRQAGFETLP